MKIIGRVSLTLLVALVFGVLALCAAASELRKKKKLGPLYEGPLED